MHNDNPAEWQQSCWIDRWTQLNDLSLRPGIHSWKLKTGHGNRGEGAGWGKVRMSGYIYRKLVEWSLCLKLQAESAEMLWAYIIQGSDNGSSSWSEFERPWSVWMQIIIHWSIILAVNNDYIRFAYNCWASNNNQYVCKVSINRASTILNITILAINSLCSHIHSKCMYWPTW